MAESIGLMEALKRLVENFLAIGHARIQLLSNEVEEERLRIQQMLVYGLIVLFFFGLGIIALMAFIVMLFWDNHVAVMGGLTALCFIIAILVWNALGRLAKEKSKLFSASLAELSKDRERLAPRHE